MPDRYAYCTFCGARFVRGQPWPRRCAACGETSYLNPKPVAVAVQPVGASLLTVRRAIPPAVGKPALPGGYVDAGESWQAAVVREMAEEVGLTADPASVTLFDTLSAPDGTLLVFGLLPRLATASALPAPVANQESQGWELLDGPRELAFPLHTAVAARYFAGL
jgi:ADP-ribose pyrophosphatase YjhB (NUDIX family)